MRSNNRQHQSGIEEFGQITYFNFASDSTFLKTSALLHIDTSNLGRRSRIRSRRARSFYSTALLVKSPKFTGMDSTMLRSRWSSSRPALDDSQLTIDVENKFGIDIANLAPIKNGCGEGISNCQGKIAKNQSWPLNSEVDRGGNEQGQCVKGKVFNTGVLGFNNCGQEQPKAEEISQTAVNSRALRSKNNGMAASFSQTVEWRVSHE